MKFDTKILDFHDYDPEQTPGDIKRDLTGKTLRYYSADGSAIDLADRGAISFSDEQQEIVKASLDDWSNASGIIFTEVSDTTDSYGDMRFIQLDFEEWTSQGSVYSSAAAFAYHPLGGDGYAVNSLGGDIFFDNTYQPYDGYFEHVVSHEIGHALGLAHPFEGYAPIGDSGDSLDNHLTVMTYDKIPELYGTTPLPIDILAMEFLYGGSAEANLGDTEYKLDVDIFNTYENGYTDPNYYPYSKGARVSIIDDEGEDELNLSGFKNGIFLNLLPGSWSNFTSNDTYLVSVDNRTGKKQIASSFLPDTELSISSNEDLNSFGQLYLESETFIENCELTEYDDVIFDNASDNIIRCGDGNDLVSLSLGIDTVYGGNGSDTVSLFGSMEDYISVRSLDNSRFTFEKINQTPESAKFSLEDVELVSFYDEVGVTAAIPIEQLVQQLQTENEPLFDNRKFPEDQSFLRENFGDNNMEVSLYIRVSQDELYGREQLVLTDGSNVQIIKHSTFPFPSKYSWFEYFDPSFEGPGSEIEVKGYAVYDITSASSPASEITSSSDVPVTKKYLVAYADKDETGAIQLYVSTVLGGSSDTNTESTLEAGNYDQTLIGSSIQIEPLNLNFSDNGWIEETLGAEAPMVNIAQLKNGNIGVNLSKIDSDGKITQLKFVEIEFEASDGSMTEVAASVEYPGFIPLDFQVTDLGSDADFFMGEDVQDHISIGGGDDKIMSAGGDDVVVVQGQGDVEVDTGEGDDRVIVEDGWSGTLLVKNGVGDNILELQGNQENFEMDIIDGQVQLILNNGSTITIDEQHSLNTQTGLVEISDKGFEYIKIDGYDDQGLLHEGEDAYSTYMVLGSNDANYLVASQPDDAESNDEVYVGAGDGADIIEASAYNAIIEGGKGDDTIRISATSGKKFVFGDIFNGDSGNIISSQNSSFADVVEIAWGYDASTIEQVSHGYRITNSDLDAVVEVFDVEVLKFATGDTSNPWDIKYLTAGAPVGSDSWMNGHAGKDIAYGDGSDIRFVLGNGTAPDGAALSDNGTSDILQVYANVTTVTQESYTYYQKGKVIRTTYARGYAKKTGTRDVEITEEALIWEGDRTSVDAFNFSDGVSINVINVADTTWSGEPIYSTIGTEGVDIIFGNDSDNLIDGKGGDDIIFGGDGDDVIIGGEGDDILVGGAGDDTIRGDMVDEMDAAREYFANLDSFDTNTLSIETSTVVEGNDVILGGDGVDDIESGEGKNIVASGRADMDGDGEADLDTIKEHMTTNKDIFEDDDWIQGLDI